MLHAHQRIDRRVIQRVENAAGGREGGAEPEGKRNHDINVNADQLSGLWVQGNGPHRGPDFGALNDELERNHQQHGDHDHEQLVGRDDQPAEMKHPNGKQGGKRPGCSAEEKLSAVFKQQ